MEKNKFEIKIKQKNPTNKQVIENIKAAARSLNQSTLTMAEYDKYKDKIVCASSAAEICGSWVNALELAGLKKGKRQHVSMKISKNELIDDLQSVAKRLHVRTLKAKQYNMEGQFSSASMNKEFGSWTKALKAAGLDVVIDRDVSCEDLFRKFATLYMELDRQPIQKDMDMGAVKGLSSRTCKSKFGSWDAFLIAFQAWIPEHANEFGDNTQYDKQSAQSVKVIKHKTKRFPSSDLELEVLKRDDFRCVKCGEKINSGEYELHHIIPWDDGGETRLNNLCTLCSKCHKIVTKNKGYITI